MITSPMTKMGIISAVWKVRLRMPLSFLPWYSLRRCFPSLDRMRVSYLLNFRNDLMMSRSNDADFANNHEEVRVIHRFYRLCDLVLSIVFLYIVFLDMISLPHYKSNLKNVCTRSIKLKNTHTFILFIKPLERNR